MEVDDDILVVKDSRPKEPLEDPLALIVVSDSIINLDSSDEELPINKPNQTSFKNYNAKTRNPSGGLKINIDLDTEDSGPMASIDTLVNRCNTIDNCNGKTNVTQQASDLNGVMDNYTGFQKLEYNKEVKKHNVYDHSNATTPVFESVCAVDESHEPVAFIIPKPSASIQNSLQHMETHNSCVADKTSQQQKTKAFVKKNNPIRFKSKIITEPTVSKGKKTKNSIMDLNLNFNKYKKRSAITDQSNKIPLSPSSTCAYNVALGLVLNVNNSNNSSDSCKFTSANMSRINDVALDVSVNLNNRDKPSTVTSGQDVQNIPLHTPRQPTSKYNIPNLFHKWYSCVLCKFQTTKIDYIISHNCSGRPESEIPLVGKKSKNSPGCTNIVFKTKQNVYECKICKINNPNFQVIKLHMCPSLSKNNNQNIFRTVYCCPVCLFETTDLETLKFHTCTLAKYNPEKKSIEQSCFKNIESSEQGRLELSSNNLQKIFSCAVCSFQTTDLEIIKCHSCTSSKIFQTTTDLIQTENFAQQNLKLSKHSLSSVLSCMACTFKTVDFEIMKSHQCTQSKTLTEDGTTRNLKQIEVVQAGSLELPRNKLPKVLDCVSCSFRTTDLEVIKSHNCLSLSNSNVDIQGELIKQMYCCSVCSFQTTDLKIVKSHSCPSPKLQEKNIAQATTSKDMESLELSENNIKKKLKTLQCRGSCSFETKCMCASSKDKINLPNSNENSLQQNQNITPSEKMFCCVSCSFKSLNLNAVKSHRCRDHLSQSSPRSSPIIQEEDISCPLCVNKFHDKYLLFQHLRFIHLKFVHKLRCHYCDELLIDTELAKHLKEYHKTVNLSSECVSIYECRHCGSVMYDPDNVPAHLNAHLLYLFDKVGSLKILSSVGTISLYSCILCGIHSPNIEALLSHCCQPFLNALSIKSIQIKQLGEHNTIPKKSSKKYIRTSEASCYSCKKNIYRELLQCECENVYHLTCVDMYAGLLPHNKVNNMPNWFCPECNNENVNNLTAARIDINILDWCMDVADEVFLKEVRKQEIIAKELKKINEETEKMKKEFQQVKTFIFKSKSEKINNKLVRSVCNIIDSYMGAECD